MNDVRYFVRRFFALYIDMGISNIIVYLLLYSLNITIDNIGRPMYIMLLCMGFAFLYYASSDFIFGRTLGKKILNLQIDGFDRNNKTKLLGQVIVRNLVRWVPFDPISFLFYYDDNRLWHDKASKTSVVWPRKSMSEKIS